MPSGDAQRTWFPEMIAQLRAEWHEGMSIPAPHRPAGRTRRNAAPDSGWPEHPDTDYHLPQVWDDGTCGGTACQRARLDPGVGPVRNRVKGSNPRRGERLGSLPQATSAGHRRKGLGRGPAKLPALKIAARVSLGPELAEASSGEAMRQRD